MIAATTQETRNASIPDELKALNQWMTWGVIDGTKVPNGKANDSFTWHTFDRVAKREQIAFVFSESDPYTGIDLDDCIDTDGQYSAFAVEILSLFKGKAYAEISPSGTGIKLWVRGRKPAWARCKHGSMLEVYDVNRFFAVTGDVIGDFTSCSQDAQRELDQLCHKYLPSNEQVQKSATAQACTSFFAVDQERRLREYAATFEPISEGGRNPKAFEHSGNLRALVDENHTPPNEGLVIAVMREWNSTNLPPLSDAELLRTIESSRVNGKHPAPKLPEPRHTIVTETENGFIESASLIDFDNFNKPEDELTFPPPCPGLIADVTEFSLATAKRKQPLLSLLGAIALQSVICARKVRTSSGTRPGIGIVCLAPTGGGKQHPREVNSMILTECQMDELLVGSGFTTDIPLYRAVADIGAGLTQIDEFGRFLAGGKSANTNEHKIVTAIMQLLTSDNDASFKPLRYAVDSMSITMRYPCLTLFACATREQFFNSQSDASLLDGFLGRLLFANVSEMPPIESDVESKPVPQCIIDVVRYWGEYKKSDLEGVSRGMALPDERVVRMSAPAKDAIKEFSREADNAVRQDDRYSVLWSRAYEKAVKLSLIAAMSRDHTTEQCELQDVIWGIRFTRVGIRRMVNDLDSWMGSSQFESDANEIYRAIKRQPGKQCDATRLNSLMRKWPAKYRNSLLQALVDQGRILQEFQKPDEGGNTKRIYHIIR